MKQIAVLPSGVQNQHKGAILYFDDKRFCMHQLWLFMCWIRNLFFLRKFCLWILELFHPSQFHLKIQIFSLLVVLMATFACGTSTRKKLWPRLIPSMELFSWLGTRFLLIIVQFYQMTSTWWNFITGIQSFSFVTIKFSVLNQLFIHRDVRKSSGGSLQEMFCLKSPGLKYTTAKWVRIFYLFTLPFVQSTFYAILMMQLKF